MLNAFVKQADQAARLLERARAACENTRGLRGGDRVFTPLNAEAEFDQGTAPAANLIFNVPADADFWAYRLLVYPFCKVVDPVNQTPDEVVYRPTAFSGVHGDPGSSFVPASSYGDFNTLVDAVVGLIFEGRELQNIDAPVMATYCADVLRWATPFGGAVAVWEAASQTPGGMVFDVPLFIPRGKNLTLRVTPTFLGSRSITETMNSGTTITRQHRYKIVAVLEGEKKVNAFR